MCLLACLLYAVNRWGIKPHSGSLFFHAWFNDGLLIPCALPPLLWMHRRLGWRADDRPPTGGEIAAHWAGWSVLFEGIGPHLLRTTGDPWDVVAYGVGAVGAWLWWRRPRRSQVERGPNFDWLAPHYRWLEAVLAGGKLQRCRTAQLGAVGTPRRILLVGEGNGRFLAACHAAFPAARITVVEASGAMLARARARWERGAGGGAAARVEFFHSRVEHWAAPPGEFDLVVTHFFLDCFRPGQLDELIPRLAASAAPGARWLVADFQVPATGVVRRLRAELILALMYWFFRWGTGLPASELTPPDGRLAAAGFRLRARREMEWGLLHTDLWEQAAPAVGPPREVSR